MRDYQIITVMENEKLNINQWALEDRPREKLMQKGASALSNAELLAILIGSGNVEETAVELMRRVLSDCSNSLKTLGRMSLEELTGWVEFTDIQTGQKKRRHRYKGLGEAKAITIMAACELGRRRMQEEAAQLPAIRSSSDLYDYFRPRMQDLAHEECYALLMNQACKVIDCILIGKGGLTETSVDIRLVLREALLRQTPVIALAHNHPSGNCRPSPEDSRITDKLNSACKLMNIRLLDHIIVTDGKYFSYVEEGLL